MTLAIRDVSANPLEETEVDFSATRESIRRATTTDERQEWAQGVGASPKMAMWSRSQIFEFCAAYNIPVVKLGGQQVMVSPTKAIGPVRIPPSATTTPCGKEGFRRVLVRVNTTLPIDTEHHCGNLLCTICNKNAEELVTKEGYFPDGPSKLFRQGRYDDGSKSFSDATIGESDAQTVVIQPLAPVEEVAGGEGGEEEDAPGPRQPADAQPAAPAPMAAPQQRPPDSAKPESGQSDLPDQSSQPLSGGQKGEGEGDSQGQGQPQFTPEEEDRIREIAREEDAENVQGFVDEVTLEHMVEEGLLTNEKRVREIANEVTEGIVLEKDGISRTEAAELAEKTAERVLNSVIKTILVIKVADKPEVAFTEHVHPVFQDVLETLALGHPVMLVGPSGCGKTHMAGQLHRALNARAYGSVSCTPGMSEWALTGRFLPIGDGMYLGTPFVDIYENGGLFLLDEVDAADASVLIVQHQALSNDNLPLPNRMNKPTAEKHPEFVLISAANTYGHGANRLYVGRNQLDAATLDRFEVIDMDYDRQLEAKLVPNPELCQKWWQVRDRINALGLKRVWSTRKLMFAARWVAAGKTPDWAIRRQLAGWKKDELQKIGYE